MTGTYFNTLSKQDQIGVVYKEGIYVADRQEPEFTIVLYQLDNMYVEVFYHESEDDPIGIQPLA